MRGIVSADGALCIGNESLTGRPALAFTERFTRQLELKPPPISPVGIEIQDVSSAHDSGSYTYYGVAVAYRNVKG
jgi:hypothetical protein